MKIAVITSAPELVQSYLDNTILKQAILNKTALFHIIDIRDFAIGSYRQIDDAPFGGVSGMVMMAEPLIKAIESAFALLDSSIDDTKVIYPTPQGKVWNHNHVIENTKDENLKFICGRYKGIDQRGPPFNRIALEQLLMGVAL